MANLYHSNYLVRYTYNDLKLTTLVSTRFFSSWLLKELFSEHSKILDKHHIKEKQDIFN